MILMLRRVQDIQRAIALIPGPAVSIRSFQQLAPRHVRNTTQAEILHAMRTLHELGTMVPVKVPHSREQPIFVKKQLNNINWNDVHNVNDAEFTDKFDLPVNKAISQGVSTYLQQHNYIRNRDDTS